MEISTKNLAIGIGVSIAIGAAFGYFEAPTKKETKVEYQTVEKEVIKEVEVTKEADNKNTDTVIIETIDKDGTIHRETHIVDKGVISIDKSDSKEDDKSKEEHKTIDVLTESKKTDWSASAMVSPNSGLNFSDVSYGLVVERRIIGPFKAGIYGMTNKTYGVTMGMGF
jgi:hypothetical protein